MPSLEKYFTSFAHFLIGMFGVLKLSYINPFYIFVSTLSWICNLQTPSPAQCLSLGFVDGLLPRESFLVQRGPICLLSLLFPLPEETHPKNTLLRSVSKKLLPVSFQEL